MNELCLFAGAGGGSIASKWLLGWDTVCYVEWDKYCQQVLQARIRDGLLDDAPIWDDVRTFDGRPWRGCVDIITAGFPCQPFSVAGKRKGADDERNMWPDTIRIIREVQPRYAFLENVPGLLVSGYFGRVLGDLAASGYDIRWRCLSAAEVGAPHRRDRLWIVADAKQNSCTCTARQRRVETLGKAKAGFQNGAEQFQSGLKTRNGSGWISEPDVGRVANGVASRVDQLKALGNGQVPQVVAKAWELLTVSIHAPARGATTGIRPGTP